MESLKNFSLILSEFVKSIIIHDKSRQKAMFIWVNLFSAFFCLMLLVVNALADEEILIAATLSCSVLCFFNIVLICTAIKNETVYRIFCVETLLLLFFLFITGFPDGFGAMWLCLIPPYAILLFGCRMGSRISLIALVSVIILFWMPLGDNSIMYGYSTTFVVKLPFLYSAIYAVVFLIELTRAETAAQIAQSECRYRYLYRHDELTGLYNRYGFNQFIDEAFGNPGNSHVAILILDIDNFKNINDTYGHNAGDEVLRSIAAILMENMSEDCKCCRWGGEEFLLLVHGKYDAFMLGERIRCSIESLVVQHENSAIRVTVSIGACISIDVPTAKIGDAIRKADACLYKAKISGKNQMQMCDW